MHRVGIATREQLLAAGLSARDISRSVASGSLRRLRRGWYASLDANAEISNAVRLGGVLSCASALAFHGVWSRTTSRLHIAFDRGLHRSNPAHVIAHWGDDIGYESLVEDPLTALSRLARCGAPLDVVIAADSMLNLRLASRNQIDSLLGTTVRGRKMLNRIDERAESGTETILRLRLRARRLRLRTQVSITGVGRVDFVVGDRLVIEVDGRKWHDRESQFERDRERDARLVALGYLVMRFSYHRVMHDMAEIEREILAVVRAREHLRLPRHDRVARNYG